MMNEKLGDKIWGVDRLGRSTGDGGSAGHSEGYGGITSDTFGI